MSGVDNTPFIRSQYYQPAKKAKGDKKLEFAQKKEVVLSQDVAVDA